MGPVRLCLASLFLSTTSQVVADDARRLCPPLAAAVSRHGRPRRGSRAPRGCRRGPPAVRRRLLPAGHSPARPRPPAGRQPACRDAGCGEPRSPSRPASQGTACPGETFLHATADLPSAGSRNAAVYTGVCLQQASTHAGSRGCLFCCLACRESKSHSLKYHSNLTVFFFRHEAAVSFVEMVWGKLQTQPANLRIH